MKDQNVMIRFIMVGLGGALGAMARYGISLIPSRTSFPILTLITNILGAILIGFIVGISTRNEFSENKILFWKTGVCGGFTTFSTFSLEAWSLFEKGRIGSGGLYIVLSVSLCLLGICLGKMAAVKIGR